MDLKDIGISIAKLGLPLLGTLLPIPGGAALGTALASAIGSSSAKPEDILATLTQNADAVAKAKQFEAQHQEEMLKIVLDAATAQVQAVNATMQGESKSEHWPQWFWRPFWGMISGAAFLVVCIFVCLLLYQAIVNKDAAAIGSIPVVIGAFTTLFAVPGAILGITAWGRNQLKVNQLTASTDGKS
jgi:ABC-type multidrug transport system fused ATPase/permease subunit